MTATAEAGTARASASNAQAALLARPPSAASVTPIRRHAPLADVDGPCMPGRRDFGCTFTLTLTPSGSSRQNMSQQWPQCADDQRLIERANNHAERLQQQNQDERADVDAAKARYEVANGPQRRLRHPVQEVADRPNHPVTGVQHSERRQHAEYGRQNHRPHVEPNKFLNEPNDSEHTADSRRQRTLVTARWSIRNLFRARRLDAPAVYGQDSEELGEGTTMHQTQTRAGGA